MTEHMNPVSSSLWDKSDAIIGRYARWQQKVLCLAGIVIV